MDAGPHKPGSLGPVHGTPDRGNRFGSPQWSDNVARMHLFMKEHPQVIITTPTQNGTKDFIAAWPDGELKDRSLGWLMDKMEERFGPR